MNSLNEIKVVIYCTAYNHEPYIRDALDGFIMQQTDFKFHVIVHDDASTDNTAAIIREYEEKHPEIIKAICQTENQYSKGKSIRTIMAEHSQYGKYAAICEGDDYWTDPLKLQKQYDFMETHPEYSLHSHEVIDHNMRDNTEKKFTYGMKEGDISLDAICKELFGTPHTSSLFMRKELYTMHDWMRGLSCDRILILYCAVNGKVYFSESIMSLYRRYSGADSWTVSRSKNAEIKIRMNNKCIEFGKILDIQTNYVHSETLYWWIVENKYLKALNQRKFTLIYYDNYKGKKRKTNWVMTLTTFPLFRIALKCIPSPIIHLIARLLFGRGKKQTSQHA